MNSFLCNYIRGYLYNNRWQFLLCPNVSALLLHKSFFNVVLTNQRYKTAFKTQPRVSPDNSSSRAKKSYHCSQKLIPFCYFIKPNIGCLEHPHYFHVSSLYVSQLLANFWSENKSLWLFMNNTEGKIYLGPC